MINKYLSSAETICCKYSKFKKNMRLQKSMDAEDRFTGTLAGVAVTGALAGAYYGERWKQSLIDRHENKVLEELMQLGKTIYLLSQQ